MIHLIHRHIIEHIEVFIGVASMHIHSGHAFGTLNHSGLGVKRFDHIGFANNAGVLRISLAVTFFAPISAVSTAGASRRETTSTSSSILVSGTVAVTPAA